MKKVFKLVGIIALVAVIGFSFIACGGGDGGGGNDGGGKTPGGSDGGGTPAGPQWTPITQNVLGGPETWHGIKTIAYVNNIFIAGDTKGRMATSTDGVTWTAVTQSVFSSDDSDPNSEDPIWAIAYGNNKFVAVGGDYRQRGKVAVSSDGVTWTAAARTGSFFNNSVSAIAYGNGKFVAAASDRLATSPDGETWTDIPMQYNGSGIRAIAYGDGKFVASNGNGEYSISYDGETWSGVFVPLAGSSYINTIVYGGAAGQEKFFAGCQGKIAYSTEDWNGMHWTAVTPSGFESANIYAIAYGNNKFVASSGGITAYSTDGAAWPSVTYNIFGDYADVSAIAYGNGKFVAGGQYGKMAYLINN